MMRAIGQPTGFRTYVEGLVEALLRIDRRNRYLLIHRQPEFVGRFAAYENAEEILVRPSAKLLWDQFAVPWAAWRRGADIIYNPKFTVPLLSPVPVAMGLQEPTWFALPHQHPWWDVAYMRLALPLYCRKCRHFFPWTRFQLEESRKHLGMSLKNATVTYGAPREHFRRRVEPSEIEEFRSRHALPETYLVSVVNVLLKGYRRQVFTPIKNVETTIRAYGLIRDRVPHRLVVAGAKVREFLDRRGWREEDLEGVIFLGFVRSYELPALYAGADLFVIASLYEGFGVSLVEAMAQGCPVVASSSGACPETAGGAALLADPSDPADFAGKMLAVLDEPGLRRVLREASLRRADFFDWDRSAKIVLERLEKVARPSPDGVRQRDWVRWALWMAAAHPEPLATLTSLVPA